MNYLRIRELGLVSRGPRPHILSIAPSVSSLAATESSSCSRSDAELLIRSILHSSFTRPRPRIALLRKPTADTEKAAHAQFRTPPSLVEHVSSSRFRSADHLHTGPAGS